MTDWNKLKVTELKEELKARSIPLTGLKLKADFVARLQELENNVAAATDVQDPAAGLAPVGADKAEAIDSTAKAEAEQVVAKDDVAEDNDHNGETEEESIHEKSGERLPDTILPEMVDMYSSSQVKPTPSQPLTEILAAKGEAKAEDNIPSTSLAPVKTDPISDMSSPVPTQELMEDSKKRKRRSVTPPPSTVDIALKKARARDGTPVITKQVSSLDKIQAATDAAEAIQAPDGLGDNILIKENGRGLRGEADVKPSQSAVTSTGNNQAALRIPSPGRREAPAVAKIDRHVAAALHPASRSLYLRNFKRPLQAPTLREHLAELGRPPSSSTEDPITTFHLDNIRTHALVSFTSIAAATRARSAIHDTVFPDEASRVPIWVDFVPDEKIESWITKETSGSDRNRKWEVAYVEGQERLEAIHQEVNAGLSRKPNTTQPQQISMSEALSRPAAPIAPDVRSDRAALVHRQDDDRRTSRSDAKQLAADETETETGTGFKALDELFLSTIAKPKLYYKSAANSVVGGRMEMMKDLRVGHSEMGRSGDEGMKRYSFEVYKGRDEWVDKGPEFGYGRRGVEALEGRRGRGGGYRGGRGNRGREWRGRY